VCVAFGRDLSREMVAHFDLTNDAGLKNFDKHLVDHSYVHGFVISGEDFAVHSALASAPDAGKFVHVARWYKHIGSFTTEEKTTIATSAPAVATPATVVTPAAPAKTDDDVDLFGDDEDDEEHEQEIMRRAKELEDRRKAAGKERPQAKSAVCLDVKPWDDTIDLLALEKKIRETVKFEGLEWKASKLTPVAFGINKLQISCHVIDDLVSLDDVQEKIQEFEDEVQSTDIDSFTKL